MHTEQRDTDLKEYWAYWEGIYEQWLFGDLADDEDFLSEYNGVYPITEYPKLMSMAEGIADRLQPLVGKAPVCLFYYYPYTQEFDDAPVEGSFDAFISGLPLVRVPATGTALHICCAYLEHNLSDEREYTSHQPALMHFCVEGFGAAHTIYSETVCRVGMNFRLSDGVLIPDSVHVSGVIDHHFTTLYFRYLEEPDIENVVILLSQVLDAPELTVKV